MKKNLAALFAFIGWFAVIAQYYLMIKNEQASVLETTNKFFSFFTILTNLLVAIYFTSLLSTKDERSKFIVKPGTLTAITVFITVVGLVYQVSLRHLWQPKGLQLIVDELLHSIIPVLVIIFWYLYETPKPIRYKQIAAWAIYPLLYLVYILIRGSFSGLYLYPFINVTTLGMSKALVNAGMLLLVFAVISALFIFIGKLIIKR